LPSLKMGWLPQEPMDMNGYWLVCLNPQAPPTVAKIQESMKEMSRIAQIDETQMPAKRRKKGNLKKNAGGAQPLTVVVGAGAVGLAVPGGPGRDPAAIVAGGVAGVEVLRVELGLAAAADGEEGQEHERRGGEGGPHRFYRHALDWAGSSKCGRE
jgi:hypothetical protein